ncbi:hypothetical protein Ancab_006750 [Ancistrocladus abbreviatus]
MGSVSSHLRSHPPNTKVKCKTKRSLSFLTCGASGSSASETEDYTAESLVNSAESYSPVLGKSEGPARESVLTSSEGSGFTSPETDSGASSGSSNGSSEYTCGHALSNIETSTERKHFPEGHELVSSLELNSGSKHKAGDTAHTSCRGQQSSMNETSNVHIIGDVVHNHLPQTNCEGASFSNLLHQEQESVPSDEVVVEEHYDEATGLSNSESAPYPVVSVSGTGSQSLEDDIIQEVIPSGIGFLMSDSIQGQAEASILHVDMVSISSGSLSGSTDELSTHEERRNGRRRFWDAFSTRSSRRHTDFSTILFATEDDDNPGSHRRWLLDFGGDSWHLGSGNHIASERRWHLRSQLVERLRGGAGETGRRTTCPLGLHPDGSCLCELDEEASTQASISRIVMLAEALFEVLDEIHRHPTSFPLSMVSHPAPELVVDSLPLKSYEKPNAVEIGEDVEQCYICLAEYEEGDKIRILPCHHEYHMSCVDKWLKEIHGVCPLCRGSVCEAFRQGPPVDLDASLLRSEHV